MHWYVREHTALATELSATCLRCLCARLPVLFDASARPFLVYSTAATMPPTSNRPPIAAATGTTRLEPTSLPVPSLPVPSSVALLPKLALLEFVVLAGCVIGLFMPGPGTTRINIMRVKLVYSGFETCLAPSTRNVWCWDDDRRVLGCNLISNHDCWHHIENHGCDAIAVIYSPLDSVVASAANGYGL